MAEEPKSKRTLGVYKCEESAVVTLPRCKVYSIRMRPKKLPKDDTNYKKWDIVAYNIEKISKNCQLTATGNTLDDAIDAMQKMLDLAQKYRVSTFNGVPGSGLSKGKYDTPNPEDINYTISKVPFYKVKVSFGPWKPKKQKGKGGQNNNCGRHQIKQEMRNIVVSIELRQIRNRRKKSRG